MLTPGRYPGLNEVSISHLTVRFPVFVLSDLFQGPYVTVNNIRGKHQSTTRSCPYGLALRMNTMGVVANQAA